MPKTWTHPKLGDFKSSGGAWVQTIDAPGFKAFSYDTGYPNARKSNGKYQLMIEGSEDENEKPSPEVIALAAALLDDPPRIVDLVINALWLDFSGKGPNSGMWWHGHLEKVERCTSPLKSPKDLLKLLQLEFIYIRGPQPARSEPFLRNPATGQTVAVPPRAAVPASAELEFFSAFEREHGVGILTDTQSILGISYQLDVPPFRLD